LKKLIFFILVLNLDRKKFVLVIFSKVFIDLKIKQK
jgi:hypothetical protein